MLYTQEVKYQPGADKGWTEADQTYSNTQIVLIKREQNARIDFSQCLARHERIMIIVLICVIYHISSWWSNNKNTTETMFFSSDYKEMLKMIINSLNHKLSLTLDGKIS